MKGELSHEKWRTVLWFLPRCFRLFLQRFENQIIAFLSEICVFASELTVVFF